MRDQRLETVIEQSDYIVFFGGAGVSTESGIPDFRSSDGLYRQSYQYPPEEVVSHSFFKAHPEEFYDFYKSRMMFLEAQPNKAHLRLAELEAQGKLKAVVTQNIDGLHQMAGSRKVLELHGSIHRNYCQKCHRFYDAGYVKRAAGIPHCTCGGVIKPDVVLYEEALRQEIMEQTVHVIGKADTLIIGGTSLAVYPAAGFIHYFRGENLVVINKAKTSVDSRGTLCIQEPIGEVLG